MRNHRAVEYGLNYLNRNDKSLVRCVSILDSMVQFWNEEGLCCPLVQSFLLLGLEVNLYHKLTFTYLNLLFLTY